MQKINSIIKIFIYDIIIDVTILFAVILYSIVSWEYDLEHVLGVFIALIGLLFWLLARKQLGKSFSVKPEAKELVVGGLYSKIRNPIYVFSFIAFTGATLATDKPKLFPILGIILLVQLLRISKEDKVLEQKFGTEYLEYKTKTWF